MCPGSQHKRYKPDLDTVYGDNIHAISLTVMSVNKACNQYCSLWSFLLGASLPIIIKVYFAICNKINTNSYGFQNCNSLLHLQFSSYYKTKNSCMYDKMWHRHSISWQCWMIHEYHRVVVFPVRTNMFALTCHPCTFNINFYQYVLTEEKTTLIIIPRGNDL